MLELTPEQRRQIYEEEKKRLEHEKESILDILILLNLIFLTGLSFLITLAKYSPKPSIEDLRKAYPGLGSEE